MTLRMVELLPKEAVLHSNLGTAHNYLGRHEEALTAYENALRFDPKLDQKGEPTSFYRALTLSLLGRDREALKALEQCEPPKSKIMQFKHDLTHARIQMSLGRWKEGRSELDRLLERYPPSPSLWTGKDLNGLVSAPLKRSSNPKTWQRFITIWLDSFKRNQRLAELGQALVRSLRSLILPWVNDQTARDWYETWKELAGDIDEMAVPLRLLGAGVEYSATRDPRVLLGLAREERGLLEPCLSNLLAEEPTELDREMEALLRTVEQRLAEEAAPASLRTSSTPVSS
jgi:tetratricopeptide (TPR) repeat protein